MPGNMLDLQDMMRDKPGIVLPSWFKFIKISRH